jgi:NAD(P)-dependent dehydrogenase (short-subunit alcohol dehydrogenase family)
MPEEVQGRMRLLDRVALVTGGGSGIGAQICRTFAREGARVAVTDVRPEAAAEVAAAIAVEGGRAIPLVLNVTERAQVEAAARTAAEELGPLDIWVNNAGVSYIVPFMECGDDLWQRTLDINLTGAFIGCQVALGYMRPRRKGVILNMSSQSGKVGNSHYGAYCASKFGIIGLTQSLAVEFAGEGIRVNALCPGVVFTPMWDEMKGDYARKRGIAPEEVREYFESKIPLGRLCMPEDVAAAAVFLASDEASYLTGQAINLAGGVVMH